MDVVKEGDILPSIVHQQGKPDYSKPVDVDLLTTSKVAMFQIVSFLLCHNAQEEFKSKSGCGSYDLRRDK